MNDLIEYARGRIAAGDPRDALSALTCAVEQAVAQRDLEALDRARALLLELDASPSTSLSGSFVRHRVARLLAFSDAHARELRSPHPAGVAARVDDFERRLGALELELGDLRALVGASEAVPAAARPAAASRRAAARPTAPSAARPARPVVPTSGPPPVGFDWGRGRAGDDAPPAGKPQASRPGLGLPRLELPGASLGWLLSARGLAWAGGIVTLLGIALLFALAVERGVLGPEERLGVGAALSAGLAGVSLLVRRRWGHGIGPLACLGTGLAGGYATLAASAALYDLLPIVLALGCAALIAGLATVAALAWRAPAIAALGLLGAMAVTPIVAHGATVAASAFLALVFAGAAAVAIVQGWRWLLACGAAVSALQVVVAVVEGDAPTWQRLALAAVFWCLYVASAIALQLRRGADLDPLTAPLVLGGLAVVTGAAVVVLETGDRIGLALLVPAVAHVIVGSLIRRLEVHRALSGLLGASGLAVAAVAAATLLDGFALAAAWSAQATLLAWLAARTAEIRFRLAALAYLTLAVGAALVEAPPLLLFSRDQDWAAGALPLVAAAVGALLVARFRCPAPLADPEDDGLVARLERSLSRGNAALGFGLVTASVLLAIEASSLALLHGFDALSGTELLGRAPGFSVGHLVLTGVYALIGTVVLGVAAARRSAGLADTGAIWVGLVAAKSTMFDLPELGEPFGPLALVLVAGAALAGSHLHQIASGRAITAAAALLLSGSCGLFALAAVELVAGRWHGLDALGLALVGLGATLGVSAAVAWNRSRQLATLSWALGAGVTVAGLALAADGWERTLSWTVLAAGLALVARRSGDRALGHATLAVALLAAGEVLAVQATPDRLFVANGDPAAGVVSVLVAAIGLASAVRLGTRRTPRERAATDALAGVLGLYGGSLAILGAWVASGGDTTADFQTGQVGVSAFWAAAGLVLLALGLARQARGLRLAGFALFGAALAKIFLYDLAALSAATRAFSFLAVGLLLLVAGVAYQRLVDRPREGRTV